MNFTSTFLLGVGSVTFVLSIVGALILGAVATFFVVKIIQKRKTDKAKQDAKIIVG